MIEKVLIANRGEIALRVIRTCKALGIKTVAVYSDEDTNSMHVKQATEAYHIGEAAPAKSYLNQEKILDVMLSSGADAVHPGYGFLSENDDFARLCEKNKITFIGPSADSMNLCGDKMECKAAMLKAEVPTVPGSPGLVKDAEDAAKVANDIGYPVMLKSVYGGGGRGIRIVTNDKELHDGFETVTSESIAAVGKSAIIVEKFLEKTRHIEYQMCRDHHGNSVHLFERECSIQRRNQKLIEQTPSPVVDDAKREEIGEIVVRAAEAVDYTNLGTAEFLRADNGEFYFIEINARLQVEHPISEMVSGLDFVKLQIDIANGEPLPFKQKDLKMNGYAIECRINAEDTFLDFAPSTGPVPDVTIPSGPNVRCDTYLYPGCTVSPFYDSLMAKLCTWGPTFDESRTRMLTALNDMYVEGVETSIPLYKTILNSEEYKKGELSTDFLKRYGMIDKLTEDLKQEKENKTDAALAAAIIHSEYFKSQVQNNSNNSANWKNKLD
ncbi:acetyl-CoA carboxylase biotin carboxylase subunit [Nitrosopumilus sp.]|uniref:Carbamoyl-phosphate synthase L chain (AccC) n=1 Tax=uncultured marine thaumarchaeote KM3_24_H11 TaxID=1456102 RepID=A0A075GVA9_9ARCH|nr:carbamoyl-phosphate synthase L chain (accC) [uncultured marine thaumarchaeote KM3_24_H11]MDC0155075.1 acetyl-CoA carboxylase biotin carboxylase subunit [Nitrosopumilus sp.]MDC0173499.1 acetyl-CoA carboxylase biotin carboxylase subunit [Nitrosopumilus sp.]MDC0639095.1 acetyl-CoA carboxylase biotin carboxylase subunit [Nitrosopumilus sp.]RCL31239.1 MAG: acetyl-CoA carboxylase biotin carboxylase subunit [Nitrosopumilus sp.]|tara:strand:+ start:886 stop:2373 length:1488 start_codon:yes stop_codon:yes gene_type:complete